MKAYERLLNYVKVATASSEETGTVPSTKEQFQLAEQLVSEMQDMGVSKAQVDDKCYVYGYVPASPGYEDKPALAFIAHLDTIPDFPGKDVHPQVIEGYDGKDIVLNDSRTIRVQDFPHLKEMEGRTLITTDGTTLLGADDKAGIANILTAVENILVNQIPHGKICLAFTPDEEIGSGAGDLDLEQLGAQYGYTVDGGAENELEYENFNAAQATMVFHGVNVHPGSAKGIMVNALKVAMEADHLLPAKEVPEQTEGYEGFFHLISLEGTVEQAKAVYLIRDHDQVSFEEREEKLEHIVKVLNHKYGEGTVGLTCKESYRNMKEKIEPCMFLIDRAREAMELAGMEPKVMPIRGGTDGAQLSFRGLPCPNLGTGGYGFHGPYEHISAEGMDKSVEVIMHLMEQ